MILLLAKRAPLWITVAANRCQGLALAAEVKSATLFVNG